MNVGIAQADSGTEPIVVECYFAAPPARVFQAWTDPDEVLKWFGHKPNSLQSAAIDLRPGGSWRFLIAKDDEQSVGFAGQYLEILHGERLVFTWHRFTVLAGGDQAESLHAEIQVDFTARGNGTDVRLVHAPQRLEDSRKGIDEGWILAFNNLKVLLLQAA